MNSRILIDSVVQQTMVFIAQLATAGGVRAPLVNVADGVFRELTRELLAQGLSKKVIADMFGMGLRTYRRRVQAAEQSKTDVGRTVWEAVLEYVRQHEPVSAGRLLTRFAADDPEIVSGVLNDFVNSGLAYRAGRGNAAVYRIAAIADFQDEQTRQRASDFVVWMYAYRQGPLTAEAIAERALLSLDDVHAAVTRLTHDGKLQVTLRGTERVYASDRFEVPWDASRGWEAAVLDHFQAMVGAVTTKLASLGDDRGLADEVGGSTWSLDVWAGHPFEREAKGTLAALRGHVEGLRQRIDDYNAKHAAACSKERVIVYLGQNVKLDDGVHREEARANSEVENGSDVEGGDREE